jgi:hypothetical protein
MSIIKKLIVVSVLVISAQSAAAQQFNSGIPAGWTGVGTYGTLGADGVVTLAPGGGSSYGYVSSYNGVGGVSPFGLGSETDGSLLRSSVFSANANDALNFSFNYVTSDGSTSFADYAWARLLKSDMTQVAILFTARTHPTLNIVPGFGMPAPDATLIPATVTINAGKNWSALGGDSGLCFSGGCGNSGWVSASYNIASAGNYMLEFGVTDWADNAYSSGLAFDGITVAGNPITPVPEPEIYAMMGIGLGLMGWVGRRRKLQTA